MSQQTRLFNPEQTYPLSRYSAKYWGTLRMLRNRPFGWSIFAIRFIGWSLGNSRCAKSTHLMRTGHAKSSPRSSIRNEGLVWAQDGLP